MRIIKDNFSDEERNSYKEMGIDIDSKEFEAEYDDFLKGREIKNKKIEDLIKKDRARRSVIFDSEHVAAKDVINAYKGYADIPKSKKDSIEIVDKIEKNAKHGTETLKYKNIKAKKFDGYFRDTVVFSENVKTVDDDVFKAGTLGASLFKEVRHPNSFRTDVYKEFSSLLSNIEIQGDISITAGAMARDKKLTEAEMCRDFLKESQVRHLIIKGTKVPDYIASRTEHLRTLTLSDNVVTIGRETCKNAERMIRINGGKNVKNYMSQAFDFTNLERGAKLEIGSSDGIIVPVVDGKSIQALGERSFESEEKKLFSRNIEKSEVQKVIIANELNTNELDTLGSCSLSNIKLVRKFPVAEKNGETKTVKEDLNISLSPDCKKVGRFACHNSYFSDIDITKYGDNVEIQDGAFSLCGANGIRVGNDKSSKELKTGPLSFLGCKVEGDLTLGGDTELSALTFAFSRVKGILSFTGKALHSVSEFALVGMSGYKQMKLAPSFGWIVLAGLVGIGKGGFSLGQKVTEALVQRVKENRIDYVKNIKGAYYDGKDGPSVFIREGKPVQVPESEIKTNILSSVAGEEDISPERLVEKTDIPLDLVPESRKDLDLLENDTEPIIIDTKDEDFPVSDKEYQEYMKKIMTRCEEGRAKLVENMINKPELNGHLIANSFLSHYFSHYFGSRFNGNTQVLDGRLKVSCVKNTTSEGKAGVSICITQTMLENLTDEELKRCVPGLVETGDKKRLSIYKYLQEASLHSSIPYHVTKANGSLDVVATRQRDGRWNVYHVGNSNKVLSMEDVFKNEKNVKDFFYDAVKDIRDKEEKNRMALFVREDLERQARENREKDKGKEGLER